MIEVVDNSRPADAPIGDGSVAVLTSAILRPLIAAAKSGLATDLEMIEALGQAYCVVSTRQMLRGGEGAEAATRAELTAKFSQGYMRGVELVARAAKAASAEKDQ